MCVVTGFNEKYWPVWGSSWLISLKELAKYSGPIVIVGYNLSPQTSKNIKNQNVKLVTGKYTGNYRADTFRHISELEGEVFAYWDADAYFQKDISEILEKAKNEFLISNKPGFLAGSKKNWQSLRDIQKIVNFMGDVDPYKYLTDYYSNALTKVEDTFNFVDVTKLSNNDPHVVHPHGPIKNMLFNRNILFSEKHKELIQKKNSTSRKLLLKSKLYSK